MKDSKQIVSLAAAFALAALAPAVGACAPQQASTGAGSANAAAAESPQPEQTPVPAADAATEEQAPAGGGASATGAKPAAGKPGSKAALQDPSKLTEKAPEKFTVRFDTNEGPVEVEAVRAWSPNGVDRFYNLVKNGFFDDVRFFRVVPGFVVQFGISGDPSLATKWLESNIPDDEVKESNKRGYLTFAKSGMPNSRSTQIFINLADNQNLDDMGFSPFARVTKGMDVVDKFYGEYGERLTQLQGQIAAQGNAFLKKEYPELDYIKKATVVSPGAAGAKPAAAAKPAAKP